jgi:hypothetical protein
MVMTSGSTKATAVADGEVDIGDREEEQQGGRQHEERAQELEAGLARPERMSREALGPARGRRDLIAAAAAGSRAITGIKPMREDEVKDIAAPGHFHDRQAVRRSDA